MPDYSAMSVPTRLSREKLMDGRRKVFRQLSRSRAGWMSFGPSTQL
jgi:hypothetical protein